MTGRSARRIRSSLVLLTALAVAVPSVRAETSRLWGKSGEDWTPASRIPDFSFAGYRSARAPLPTQPAVVNVMSFGAKGDGRSDDSDAFLAAIRAGGVIMIPRGRYRITKQLEVRKSGVVLRGEGADNTVLFFPIPLEKAVGPGNTKSPAGSWSWSGGFLHFEGENRGAYLANVLKPAPRGSRTFTVSSGERFVPGQRVRLLQTNRDGQLAAHLHANVMPGSPLIMGKRIVDFSATVVEVAGNTVTIDRPTRVDVKPEWSPVFNGDDPSVEEVGVENLTLHFQKKRYAGHHDEPGYNGIHFETIHNGWVRNVRIVNADAAVIFRSGVKFCTVDGLELMAERGRASGRWEGHHGVEIADMSQDNLVANFNIQARMIHTISLTSMAAGNVFTKGRGKDLTFDHHRKAPYENLFTEIDAGKGTEIWESGGDEEAGPFSAARETFWNIRSEYPQELPEWALWTTIVGITTKKPSQFDEKGSWFEAIAPDRLEPANLYESQLARRRALENAAVAPVAGPGGAKKGGRQTPKKGPAAR